MYIDNDLDNFSDPNPRWVYGFPINVRVVITLLGENQWRDRRGRAEQCADREIDNVSVDRRCGRTTTHVVCAAKVLFMLCPINAQIVNKKD